MSRTARHNQPRFDPSKIVMIASATRPRCFVIMPISDSHGYESGHFGRVYEHILRPAIIQAGFTPLRADDAVKTDYIVVGIIQQIIDSEMVVCDFSARNPNVMYELGIRHAFNKAVVLLKDRKTERVFDIQGLRHTEYDESLRIDSVQKDIARIANAIKETASASGDTVNSVVKLAGIRAAEVPSGLTVSADTSLLLEAIGALDKRLSNVEGNRQPQRYFHFAGDEVVFGDQTSGKIGSEVFDGSPEVIGEIVDMHPADEEIFIRAESGNITSFHAFSLRSKRLSRVPF